ncbi:MAG: hypothetical protein ACFFDT_08650 [Candidatus Hodarchaeota archaeon]
MSKHSIFYYPYASFKEKQAPLLKVAALYFDKLFILDPERATGGTIGIEDPGIAKDIALLEEKKILERVKPEDVVEKYGNAIANSVRDDMQDKAFLDHCDTSERQYWTLALAKIPENIRDDPQFEPKDKAMQRLMGDLPRDAVGDVASYDEVYAERMAPLYSEKFVYDEQRSDSSGQEIEFRYADYPISVGESIMMNHAMFAGLLHSKATPLTDDSFHHRALEIKIQRVRQLPALGDILDDLERGDRIRQDFLAKRVITDRQLNLPVLSQNIPLEKILKYREKHSDDLEQTRKTLVWLAREIRQTAWTKDFNEEIHRNVIPNKVRPLLQENSKARNSWLKWVGMGVGAAAATAQLFINPVPALSIPTFIGIMAVAGDHVIPAADEALNWKKKRTLKKGNGLHYLMNIR